MTQNTIEAQSIDKLEEQLNELRIEFNERSSEISNRINNLRRQSGIPNNHTTTNTTDSLHNFQVGDLVQITNNYAGLRGIKGTVIKTTAKFITLRDTRNNKIIKHKYTNIQRIRCDTEQ